MKTRIPTKLKFFLKLGARFARHKHVKPIDPAVARREAIRRLATIPDSVRFHV